MAYLLLCDTISLLNDMSMLKRILSSTFLIKILLTYSGNTAASTGNSPVQSDFCQMLFRSAVKIIVNILLITCLVSPKIATLFAIVLPLTKLNEKSAEVVQVLAFSQ